MDDDSAREAAGRDKTDRACRWAVLGSPSPVESKEAVNHHHRRHCSLLAHWHAFALSLTHEPSTHKHKQQTHTRIRSTLECLTLRQSHARSAPAPSVSFLSWPPIQEPSLLLCLTRRNAFPLEVQDRPHSRKWWVSRHLDGPPNRSLMSVDDATGTLDRAGTYAVVKLAVHIETGKVNFHTL